MRVLPWILAAASLLVLGGLMSGIDGLTGRPAAVAVADSLVMGHPVFDTSILHHIDITVETQHLRSLDRDLEQRVPCTFTYDGRTFPVAGIRKKGGLNTLVPLADKPGFSVKLNEFRRGQRLGPIDKLILDNGRQDEAFLNEHLGYEIYRRAGLPAPRTAFAVLTFNRRPFGIYLVEEAVDRQYLERWFGRDNAEGNLYEGSCPYDDPCTDFLQMPWRMELKHEDDEGRVRGDLMELVDVIENTPDSLWIERVSRHFDLDGFITAYAASALSNHWDGYAWNMNNYYLYHRPGDGRFVFLCHGMDSLFGVDGYFGGVEVEDPLIRPVGRLAQRVRDIPGLDRRFMGELDRVLREAWNVDTLLARIDEVDRVLHTADEEDDAAQEGIALFEGAVDEVRDFIVDRKAEVLGEDPDEATL